MKGSIRSGRILLAVITITLASIAAACSEFKTPIAPSASGAGAAGALAAQPPGGDEQLVAQIRAATTKYHNIDAAYADGYILDVYPCVGAGDFGLPPSVGGMGFHLINWALHDDPETDPLRPDLLVYEPASSPNGKPKLVALEYEVFRGDWHGAGHTEPPSLLGQEFESLDFDGLQVYALHFWLWLDNPTGSFSDFNPKTSCSKR
jgi:hypothetical protein